MTTKEYDWGSGAQLEEHSRRKLKILREYFTKYLSVRCGLPRQSQFRLAIVDGFAGGGRYSCGTSGSPLIFLEVLQAAIERLNIERSAQGSSALDIECLLILNDVDGVALETLRANVAPIQASILATCPRLHLNISFRSTPFEQLYPEIKQELEAGRYHNVLFNLDQCGHSHVDRATIVDIIRSFKRVEIFYTFVITSLLAFLAKANPLELARQLNHIDLSPADLGRLEDVVSRKEWLGTGERIVFDAFRNCAPFVSPFSINNPTGWRYWLIHFSSMYRARQVYNDVLHDNSSMQAHFGRSGLNMLAYDPRQDGALYLFDGDGRRHARDQLTDDIPRLIAENGDALSMGDFYEGIYNVTPAHSDDIHMALLASDDIEVITPSGGERRKPNTITVEDVIRLRRQRNFFPLLGPKNEDTAA